MRVYSRGPSKATLDALRQAQEATVKITAVRHFALQEYPKGELEPPKSEIVKTSLRVEDGFLIIPDAPGIGIELADDAAERHPYRKRVIHTRLHVDGSVVDQ